MTPNCLRRNGCRIYEQVCGSAPNLRRYQKIRPANHHQKAGSVFFFLWDMETSLFFFF